MDMRYMDRLQVVVDDMVGLLRLKTITYRDSWKRRGGPGAWFTTVRPWDRLETIVAREGGDIFAAIAKDPTGKDGSALACVRDVMAYMILIEAEARVNHGVGPHGPPRGAEEKAVHQICLQCSRLFDPLTTYETISGRFCSKMCADVYGSTLTNRTETSLPGPGTPEDGGHHARHPVCEGLEDAGEVTQDTAGAGEPRLAALDLSLSDRLQKFEAAVRDAARDYGIRVTCTGGGDGLVKIIRVID